jgi:Holliday junction resolvase RusA-like endonuclease
MSAALLSFDTIVEQCVALGAPRDKAEQAAAAELAKRVARDSEPTVTSSGFVSSSISAADAAQLRTPIEPVKSQSRTIVHVGADRFAVCKSHFVRERDELRATFELPPRTKKNHGQFFGIRQSQAYVRYRNAIVDAVKESKVELGLPLPDMAFNLEAVFFVDGPGKNADVFGLLQGLADALQDAGVVSDDWFFRTLNETRVIENDECPRVELIITPIEE